MQIIKCRIVACDNGCINVWEVPLGGVTTTLTQPTQTLKGESHLATPTHHYICSTGHYEKPNIVKFHPHAQDVLTSAGYDCRVFLWNIGTGSIEIKLDATPEPVMFLTKLPTYIVVAVLHVLESRWNVASNFW